MELKNKVAIVTGVSKGIGKSIVDSLLESGMKVAGWGRTNSDTKHENYSFFKTDITKFESVHQSYESSIEKFGSIDILINNAGLGIFKLLEKISLEDWDKMYHTNVNGLFYCCKKVIPSMKSGKSGHIVNISSIAGLTGIPEGTAYCGTKHAVRGISHSLYKELRKFNIKVSCVYPGSVNTEFFENYEGVTANESMLNPNDIADVVLNILKAPENALTVDVEIRPINPVYNPG